jgi:hypothetical protein
MLSWVSEKVLSELEYADEDQVTRKSLKLSKQLPTTQQHNDDDEPSTSISPSVIQIHDEHAVASSQRLHTALDQIRPQQSRLATWKHFSRFLRAADILWICIMVTAAGFNAVLFVVWVERICDFFSELAQKQVDSSQVVINFVGRAGASLVVCLVFLASASVISLRFLAVCFSQYSRALLRQEDEFESFRASLHFPALATTLTSWLPLSVQLVLVFIASILYGLIRSTGLTFSMLILYAPVVISGYFALRVINDEDSGFASAETNESVFESVVHHFMSMSKYVYHSKIKKFISTKSGSGLNLKYLRDAYLWRGFVVASTQSLNMFMIVATLGICFGTLSSTIPGSSVTSFIVILLSFFLIAYTTLLFPRINLGRRILFEMCEVIDRVPNINPRSEIGLEPCVQDQGVVCSLKFDNVSTKMISNLTLEIPAPSQDERPQVTAIVGAHRIVQQVLGLIRRFEDPSSGVV